MFKRMMDKVLGRNKSKDKVDGNGLDTIPASVLARPPSPPSNDQEGGGGIRDRSR